MTTAEKLSSLRSLMSEHSFAAYIIPSTDPHQSEYIADHWQTRQWFSGFTGSAGTVVVTQDFAGLWTDSRYFIQAEQELQGSGIELVKLKVQNAPEYIDWLKEKLAPGDVAGINGKVFAESLVSKMKKTFFKKGIIINCGLDLPGLIWKERPPVCMNAIAEHDLKYAGKSRKEKLEKIRGVMEKEGARYHLLTSLDDIAWTFNLRGSDVEYNPVFIAYALISKDNATLFVDERKLDQGLRDQLVSDSVKIEPYEKIDETLTSLEMGSGILYSTAKTSHYINLCIPAHCNKIDSISVVTRLKACKDETEIANIRNAMVKDGVALVKFFKWLEDNIGKEAITEITLDEKLTSIRSSQSGHTGSSFSTIAGYKDHGAIIHYRATPETVYHLSPEGILLLDSGAQYFDGTTDITRTVTLGKPTEEQVRNYTLVLKGLIQLSLAVFPEGTKGFHLDVLARKALWEHSKNYGHGTGHGVGYFLNVHEGPQGISPNSEVNIALEPGMIQSNEPGFYKEGEYGMRLENLILVTEHSESEYGRFLQFDTLTLFPFDSNLIDTELLCDRELGWLNKYHKMVFEKLSPSLAKEENQWLLKKTKDI